MPIIGSASGITVWADMFGDVAASVPQCPTFEMEDYLRRAAREFLSVTGAWRDRGITLLTTVADQTSYDFDLPSGTVLNRIHSAFDGDDEVTVERPGDAEKEIPADSDSTWVIGINEDRASFRLSPAPDTADIEIIGTVSYLPATNATGIPTWLYDDHRYEIASGAIALLVMQPGKPWSSPATRKDHQDKFESGMSQVSNRMGPVKRTRIRVKHAL